LELYEVICRFLQTLPEFNDEFVDDGFLGVVVVTGSQTILHRSGCCIGCIGSSCSPELSHLLRVNLLGFIR
jgi:hypothetical protein